MVKVALSTFLSGFILFSAPAVLAKEKLIGGQPTTDYPEAVYISVGNSRCSATIVGKKAVVTAAHCIQTGARAKFTLNNKSYSGIGTQAPFYRQNDQDVAMILLDAEVTDIKPAIISRKVIKDITVKLSGYGCIRRGGGGGNDGIFREGDAKVTSVPTDTSNNYDFVSVGTAALCFGDSGGPAWLYESGTFSDGRAQRYLVGVNSKGDIATTSYLSYLQKPKTIEFIKNWAEKNSVTVCGINNDCEESTPISNLSCSDAEHVIHRCLVEKIKPEWTLCQLALTNTAACIDALIPN